jgi:hypothetical protein
VYHNCQVETFRKFGQEAVEQRCVDYENPGFGFMHFDHIGGSLLALFQVTAMDQAPQILNYALESEEFSKPISCLLFFTVSCFNTFLLLGLLVAVVTGTFKNVRERQGTSFLTERQLSDLKSRYDPSIHSAPPSKHFLPLYRFGPGEIPPTIFARMKSFPLSPT